MTTLTMKWTSLLTLFVFWTAVVQTQVQGQNACNFGSGPGCKFPCRCAGGALCDEVTGQCPDDRCLANLPDDFPSGAPEAGWEGPGCQTGNAAYNKSAWQYGQYKEWSADRAVDGVVDRRHCSHPAGHGMAWWTVDLGALYTVYRVTVANTVLPGYEYLRNLRVFVSNSSLPKHVDRDDAVVLNSQEDIQSYGFVTCGDFPGQVARGEDAKVTCGQPLIGRYVLVWKYRAESGPSGAIIPCEVTVVGHRYAACDGCETGCNHVYGCIADCPAGKNQTTFCVQDCADGYYGVNCRHACSAACRSSCRSVDGKCNGGCQDWWLGDTCDREIGSLATTDLSLTISATTTDSVSLRWSRLSGVAQGLESHYGYVIMLLGPTNQWEDAARVNYTRANLVELTLGGLHNNTQYLVSLAAYRQVGPLVERVTVSSVVNFVTKAVMEDEGPAVDVATVVLGVLLGLAVIAIIIMAVRLQAARKNTSPAPETTDPGDTSVPMTTRAMTAPSVPMEISAKSKNNPGPPNATPDGEYEVVGDVASDPQPYTSFEGQTDVYEDVNQ